MNKGFVVILATLLVLSAGLVIILSAGYISLNNIKAVRNNIYSAQAYYAAEAGIEDALLRLNKEMNFSKTNSFPVGNGTATIEIADPIGGSRTITSSGDVSNRIRKVRAIRAMTTEEVNFYYGAQIGDGGMTMGNGSEIQGNVFSNGSVIGGGNITGTVKVASDNNKIQNLSIGGDAYAYSCYDCSIPNGVLYYWGSNNNCGTGALTDPVSSKSLPISDETIAVWQNEASCNNDPGCIFSGNYTVPQNTTAYLGPKKIEGDLILENNATLVVTGTIWVAGDGITTDGKILPGNNAEIKLDSSFGSTSGVVLANGQIKVQNNVKLTGSGMGGSYLMLLSTYDSSLISAIDVLNNAEGAILYAANGILHLHNNIEIGEGTAYRVVLDNNAVIQYESGLEDTAFSSGPGGSWTILEWKEVE